MKISRSLDSHHTLQAHREIIQHKKTLNAVYIAFYHQIVARVKHTPKGKVVEVGSGAGFLKDLLPKVITSDVIPGKGIDYVFPAEKNPFPNNSVAAFVMLNVFHHIKDPTKALQEMERSLKRHGKIIMIEPANSVWSRFVYRFHHERFDPAMIGWRVKGKGRLSDSNQALPWIIFTRDRQIFEQKFPHLFIQECSLHTPFTYVLSGGLSKPQFLPSALFSFMTKIETILSPLNPFLGMFMTVVLEKE